MARVVCDRDAVTGVERGAPWSIYALACLPLVLDLEKTEAVGNLLPHALHHCICLACQSVRFAGKMN